MLIRELAGKELNDWSGAVIDCTCGKRHVLDTAFFLGSGAEKEIVDAARTLAPSGCGVLLLYEKGYRADEISRLLRRGGYSVYEREISKRADYTELEADPPSEQVRAVIAVGGGYIADCGKYIARYVGLPCGVVVRSHCSPSFLVPSAALGVDIPKLFKTDSPRFIVCDPSLLDDGGCRNAAAFGAIVSRLTALFDWRFACLVRGEKICEEIYEAALGEVDSVINRLGSVRRRDKNVKTVLLESGLRLSALAAMSGSSRLFSGGDTACALALDALFAHENRRGKFQGQNEFLFSLLLADTYPKMFDARKAEGFLPPPDNNMRLEKLKTYFGADEGLAAKSVTPYLPDKAMQLYDYRIGEYESEIREELAKVKSRLSVAYRIFRRLHSDDGFYLRDYLSVDLARICIALGPEMRNKYTALTHMKNMGLTDAYLLD